MEPSLSIGYWWCKGGGKRAVVVGGPSKGFSRGTVGKFGEVKGVAGRMVVGVAGERGVAPSVSSKPASFLFPLPKTTDFVIVASLFGGGGWLLWRKL